MPAEPPVPKILLVDDDQQFTKALMIRLDACGLEVITSTNVKDAVLAAVVECPDLIITDQNMPEMTGEKFVINLRNNADTEEIPVVMITGQKVDGEKDIALEREMLGRRGADAYLAKPVDFDALIDVLNKHIRMPVV